nr:ATP/GTP binding protein like 2 [Molossus molossus]
MYHHLQYYGYFKAQRDSLPNSAMHQHVWKNNPRFVLSGSFGERDDLIPDPLQKKKLQWPACVSSAVHRATEAVSRGISFPSRSENSDSLVGTCLRPLLSPPELRMNTLRGLQPFLPPVIFYLFILPFISFLPESLSLPPFFSFSISQECFSFF